MSYLPKWLVQAMAYVLGILLVLLAISQFYTVQSKYKAVDQSHVINITAQGKVSVAPDLSTINIAVTSDGNTAEQAQTSNSSDMNKVLAFIKAQGIDSKDIQTSGYNLSPKYDYSAGSGQRIIGYTAYQNVTVKVHDLNKVGAILDGATKNGANQINGVNYGFEDVDQYKEQAREQALQNARQKAQALAQAAGVHLGKLVSFSETNDSVQVPMYSGGVAFGMGGGGSDVTPKTEPGVQDITADVSVSYEIY
ncbi:SIMPL domain-containing protein [Patescibacteria group bacterium]|nr:SIMPL domain-containing protein [Patescibacteria group bacterium]